LKSNKSVLIWLIAGALLVASMVVIGGITRLTNSGLSMVEWKLIMGSVPPLSEKEWQATFEKYQQFPEYQKVNSNFTLNDFKAIYWWEYSHRLLGRIIGIVFIIPFIIFWIKGYFTKRRLWRLSLLFILGGFQGFLGWFMVKSGLVDNPDVSHYRLAAHLIAALLLFSYIMWLIMDIIDETKDEIKVYGYNISLWALYLLALVQVAYGALVAGLNAGLFYPTYPKMNGEWIPASVGEQFATTNWLAMVSDITTVQFIHRWLGTAIFLLVVAMYYLFQPSLVTQSKRYLQLLLWVVSVQALLGILALLLSVPFILAVLHQFTALLLLGVLIINLHGSRVGGLAPT
jgi:cytochrome c oxidase assembly protein subunit 15